MLNLTSFTEIINYGTPEQAMNCLESIADYVDDVDSLDDMKEELESKTQELEGANDELSLYKDYFDDVHQCWQDYYADGHWPCPSVTDEHYKSVVFGDIQKGSEALLKLEELCSNLVKQYSQDQLDGSTLNLLEDARVLIKEYRRG